MDAPEAPSWVALLTLMVHGPDATLRGAIRSREAAGEESQGWFAWGSDNIPVFAGAAWTVELAPPPHKPHPMQLVVDAETGIVLQQRNDGFGSVMEWTGLVVGEPLDPGLFTWTGPSRSRRDERAAQKAEHRAAMARRLAWFTANVAPSPLRVEVEVTPFVHEFDERTGAFQASFEGAGLGLLARRPRSDKPWRLGWSAPAHRWTTDRWDWALGFPDAQPTPEGIESLKRQLGSGDE